MSEDQTNEKRAEPSASTVAAEGKHQRQPGRTEISEPTGDRVGIDTVARRLLDGAPCVETIPGTVVAESPPHGRGLFAQRPWSPGDVLGVLDGQVIDIDRFPSVMETLEWNALSTTLLLVRAIRTSYGFMNHAEQPNVVIDADGRTMRASRPIEPGDELTLDYFAQPVPDGYLRGTEAAALRRRFPDG